MRSSMAAIWRMETRPSFQRDGRAVFNPRTASSSSAKKGSSSLPT
jgi:hypothetical protein